MDPTFLLKALPGMLIGFVFHEWAHARMAYAFGDPTPRLTGRLTLDPRAHLDPFGAIVLVVSTANGSPMGWARPVMVNVNKFSNRFWGDVLVSLAGILMNLALATLFLVLVYLSENGKFGFHNRVMDQVLFYVFLINVWLAAFNFLPIPPLDGWHVARRLIPGFAGSRVANFLDQFGMFVLMLFIFILPKALGALLGPIRAGMEFMVSMGAGAIISLLRLFLPV